MRSGSRFEPILFKGMVLLLILSARTWAQYSGGNGTAREPYQIASIEDLLLARKTSTDYHRHFCLACDIDLSGHIFSHAIIAPDMDDDRAHFQGRPFTGHFDGQGHVLYGLCMQGKDYLGLFGNLGSGAQVKNLGLVSVSIQGNGNVGALAGFSYLGRVDSSYSTGTVRAVNMTGGLVGWNLHGTISSCLSLCAVSGRSHIGGLAGVNGGRVLNAYSAGPIRGANGIGGLIGENQSGRVETSFSFGMVQGEEHTGGLIGKNRNGRIVDSYWDVRGSGLAQSDGGVGLTGAAMHLSHPCLDAGRNLLGHGAKGMRSLWQWASVQTSMAPTDRPCTAEAVPAAADAHALDSLWKSASTRACLVSGLSVLQVPWKVTLAPGWAGGLGVLGTCLEPMYASDTGKIVVASLGAASSRRNAEASDPQRATRPAARAQEPSRLGPDPANRDDPTRVSAGLDGSSYCMTSIREGGHRPMQTTHMLLQKHGLVLPLGVQRGGGSSFRDSLVARNYIDAFAGMSGRGPSSICADSGKDATLIPLEMGDIQYDLGPGWECLGTSRNSYRHGPGTGSVEQFYPKPYITP